MDRTGEDATHSATSEERVRSQSIYAKKQLFVDASIWSNGDVSIEGQDLRAGEYEYFLTVRSDAVPALVDALGGARDTDPLDLVADRGDEMVAAGESTWLTTNGVPFTTTVF